MRIIILAASFWMFSCVVSAGELYPSLLEVKIGHYFDHPQRSERKDSNRPTTQFRVPNYGPTKALFSEYSIAVLNSTENVSIITAEAVLRDITECEGKKEKVLNWAIQEFPDYKPIPRAKSHLNGEGEFGLEGSNMYFVLNCQGSYGPFWSIHFQMRGIEEDKLLKKAWSEFFEN